VTHVGEGGIVSDTRRGVVLLVTHGGRVVLLVTHVGEDGSVSDTCRGGWYC
jgi:hypothetical protein